MESHEKKIILDKKSLTKLKKIHRSKKYRMIKVYHPMIRHIMSYIYTSRSDYQTRYIDSEISIATRNLEKENLVPTITIEVDKTVVYDYHEEIIIDGYWLDYLKKLYKRSLEQERQTLINKMTLS